MALTPLPPLSIEEERAMIASAQTGDQDALVTIIRSQVRSLRSTARLYAAAEPTIAAEDLVSVGIEALMKAVSTFDLVRTTRLWTHARPLIAEAMAEEVATTGRTMTVPGRTLRKYRRALRETSTVAEARALAQSRDRMDPETFDAVHFAMTGGSTSATPEGEFTESETTPEPDSETRLLGARGPAPEGTAVARHLAAQALDALDARARQVVALAYLSGEDLTDGDIAARLGVSRPTVTRTRNAALAAMREALA